MEGKYPILKVHMLGRFSISYGEELVSFRKNSQTKAMKLLQVLLYYGEHGIAREKLLENLYGREDLSDVANNLRVTVHRLKKMLADAEFPEYDYVRIKKKVYYWDSPMEIEIDALSFKALVEKARYVEDEKEKLELLEKACKMYVGEFLPGLSGEEWVILESVQYKKLYFEALEWVCQYLKSRREYERVLELTTPACEMYPFDEWQTVRIECYIALNHYKEAIREYENTAKLFFEELGISPSEKMMSMFESMSGQISLKPQTVKDIKNGLMEEEEEQGAFYCSFPSFRDSYRLMRRIIERNGQSVYLSICTISDGKGRPIENEEKLNAMADELHRTIRHCLRRGDSFTRYSPSQFLVMLVGTSKENCSVVYDRIRKFYSRDHKSWANCLDFYESSIAEVEGSKSSISFTEGKSLWGSGQGD